MPVGQDEARHAEDRCKPPHGRESPIGADRRQPAFELLARDIVTLFCAAAIARNMPCSLSDMRGQVGQCTAIAVCAVQAKISMMDSSEGTASPTPKWSYTCWMSAAVGTALPLRALARNPQMKSRSAALSAGRSRETVAVDRCIEPLVSGCAHVPAGADDLHRSFRQSPLQVNARRGDVEVF
ncbi:hypothetical protein [Bradyrhizobium sp. 17]|uniref:hypothetical protein n=1 Tax=Bradyrhizobium sp. 17 TaxID=2782649 RepID=UPI001FFA7798|nr:hypothetical protein [Bradyrhizobium sp. 17]MCK1521426.1 hypothetical protein [Bradyrhizobium sp. 17]